MENRIRERRKEKRRNKYIPPFPTLAGLLVTAVPPKIYKAFSMTFRP